MFVGGAGHDAAFKVLLCGGSFDPLASLTFQLTHFPETPVISYGLANPVDNWCVLSLEGTLLIVGAGQIAAPSRHGHPAESTISTRLILVNRTSVPMVIACKLVCLCQP